MEGSRFSALLISMALAGCAVDSRAPSYWSTFIDSQPAPKPPTEPAPDVRMLLTSKLSEFFVASSAPTHISFSTPILSKGGWTTCVRASLKGATGRPIGMQTYLVNIDAGQVGRREVATDGQQCAGEHFEPL
jgi:hypothetical protein